MRKYEEGAFDDDAQAADLIQEYEARIAALEHLVGRHLLRQPGEACRRHLTLPPKFYPVSSSLQRFWIDGLSELGRCQPGEARSRSVIVVIAAFVADSLPWLAAPQ